MRWPTLGRQPEALWARARLADQTQQPTLLPITNAQKRAHTHTRRIRPHATHTRKCQEVGCLPQLHPNCCVLVCCVPAPGPEARQCLRHMQGPQIAASVREGGHGWPKAQARRVAQDEPLSNFRRAWAPTLHRVSETVCEKPNSNATTNVVMLHPVGLQAGLIADDVDENNGAADAARSICHLVPLRWFVRNDPSAPPHGIQFRSLQRGGVAVDWSSPRRNASEHATRRRHCSEEKRERNNRTAPTDPPSAPPRFPPITSLRSHAGRSLGSPARSLNCTCGRKKGCSSNNDSLRANPLCSQRSSLRSRPAKRPDTAPLWSASRL